MQMAEVVVIGIWGKDPFGSTINAILAKRVQGRKVEVRRLENTDQLASCHLLFISSSAKDSLADILTLAEKFHLLTVSDMAGFAGSGGMIGFVTKDNPRKKTKSIGFEINLTKAKARGFSINAKMLELATTVY